MRAPIKPDACPTLLRGRDASRQAARPARTVTRFTADRASQTLGPTATTSQAAHRADGAGDEGDPGASGRPCDDW